jgi:hypothetical protein
VGWFFGDQSSASISAAYEALTDGDVAGATMILGVALGRGA